MCFCSAFWILLPWITIFDIIIHNPHLSHRAFYFILFKKFFFFFFCEEQLREIAIVLNGLPEIRKCNGLADDHANDSFIGDTNCLNLEYQNWIFKNSFLFIFAVLSFLLEYYQCYIQRNLRTTECTCFNCLLHQFTWR